MKKLIPLFILVLLLAACGDASSGSLPEPEDDSKLHVYTTVYPLTYFTERIGGDAVAVESIYPAGSNEHSFEPTQQDMIALAEADLLFYVGLGLEGFIDSAQKTLKNEKVEFVATADAITDEELVAATSHEEDHHGDDAHAEDSHDGHDHGSTDPHVWISPVLSQKLAESIKDSLAEADPENSEIYESNYADLKIELEELDRSFAKMAEEVDKKTFFVSHAAFGYMAEPYGLEQVAIAGLNSQDEPSQKELTEIVDLAKEKNIKHIIFEQNVSSNLTEVIQKEVGAEALEMNNLGVLTQENIDNEETYFSLMEKNLETLKTALQ
ncbi:metal ABC transporter solute-binding protein, Zn/Mn family [Planococcus ruber]|uniref:metal ABC transporter solute-binding protein, Zn/Mn family n=1 Tax=Planococcus ruber TaxID=2027871 RepID=UPI001FF04186|nr:zinc ABC transporter substrate-binding protein [Planococcus ruber]MCJ1908499.1 zinc ABC transporter substrate-binding protein [Planococcus ruber]